MSSTVYNRATLIFGTGAADWDDAGETYRALLATSAYVPSRSQDFVSEVTNELSGGGYTRLDIVGRVATLDDANNRTNYDADSIQWTGLTSTQSFRYLIVYKLVTDDSDSPLISWNDFGVSVNLTGLPSLTVNWDSTPTNGTVFRMTSV